MFFVNQNKRSELKKEHLLLHGTSRVPVKTMVMSMKRVAVLSDYMGSRQVPQSL